MSADPTHESRCSRERGLHRLSAICRGRGAQEPRCHDAGLCFDRQPSIFLSSLVLSDMCVPSPNRCGKQCSRPERTLFGAPSSSTCDFTMEDVVVDSKDDLKASFEVDSEKCRVFNLRVPIQQKQQRIL